MNIDPRSPAGQSGLESVRTESGSQSLLDFVVGQSEISWRSSGESPSDFQESIRRFLLAGSAADQLAALLGSGWQANPRYADVDSIVRFLSNAIALIDGLLDEQVNAVLHHPRFQKLESSWRGLRYLTERADTEGESLIKVKALSISWSELATDFDRANLEFDQSQIFKKIYEEEFGMAGGEPFGLMVGDYDVSHRPSDVAVLRSMAGVAASAFCPFLCAAKSELLDLESFADLQVTRDHAKRMTTQEYLKWNSMREDPDSRFLGILLPKILMRRPHDDDGSRIDRFVFREDVSTPDGSGYLWGNPSYAFASVAMRSFANNGWLADIRGLRQDEDAGGLVSDLPGYSFATDSPSVIPVPVTQVAVTDSLERQLSDLGLLPLCDCKDTELAVFASGQSLQKPQAFNDPGANVNAKISAMLPYVLTASRFAHYVKAIGRTRTGSFATAEELERFLHDWVMDYVTDSLASTEAKAARPLREAEISVHEDRSRPGSFECIMRLSPHYELDEMVGRIFLKTKIVGG